MDDREWSSYRRIERNAAFEHDDAVGEGTYISISDLMSSLLLMVCALLIIALIQVSKRGDVLLETQKQLKKRKSELENNQRKLRELERSIHLYVAPQQEVIQEIGQLESVIKALLLRLFKKSGRKKRERALGFSIKPETGEVTLPTQYLLFKEGEANLLPKGRAFLKEFGPAYINRIFSSKLHKSIERILIVGYASNTGGEEINMQISLRRARAVASFLLDRRIQYKKGYKKLFRKKLLVAGRGKSEAKQKKQGDPTDRTVKFKLRFAFSALDLARRVQGFKKK